MRILFFSHYFPPEVNAPASRTFEHCAQWVAEGHDVTVITCAPNCPDGVVYEGYKNTFRSQTEEVQGIKVIRVWTYVAPNAGTIRRILNFVSYMISAVMASLWLKRPDVIIATSPQFFCGWAGVIASRLKRTKFVLEIRDIWPESIEVVGALRNRTLLKVLEFLERRMYLAADHIVAVGEGYRQKIIEKVNVAERTSVVMNGVDLSSFVPREPDIDFKRKWNLEGKFVCSYIGTIGMAHGLDVVIRAAKLLAAKGRDDIRFCLVGDGAVREKLQQEAQAAGVDSMVQFTGRMAKAEMPTVLASSDVCLVHLRGVELFGTVIPSKIFETMAMCRPIIMGVRGEACAMVLEAGAGVEMEPDSETSLLSAIEPLADNPAMTNELGVSGREYVTRNFDRKVLAKRMLRTLHEVCGLEFPADKDVAANTELAAERT
ncbi:glycosyltransferase family 4 protein [Blastopirellula marina]|uniref:Glycosyltransferase WbuB n=1 Tax=Blastopirellula marina TaxID=124 RepID=A0A2S8G1Q6_9BACT|nr:glycosyltransferase family 4 protein [Blastopirellula marina]PQO38064.1 glycosyltransferase WbuB [Blastopirellula marina]PTL44720.1 glycosyltransferase WbuB [Blastopirellula marina]